MTSAPPVSWRGPGAYPIRGTRPVSGCRKLPLSVVVEPEIHQSSQVDGCDPRIPRPNAPERLKVLPFPRSGSRVP
jgi:hypothetical protein